MNELSEENKAILENIKGLLSKETINTTYKFDNVNDVKRFKEYAKHCLEPYQGKNIIIEQDGKEYVVNRFEFEIDEERSTDKVMYGNIVGYSPDNVIIDLYAEPKPNQLEKLYEEDRNKFTKELKELLDHNNISIEDLLREEDT